MASCYIYLKKLKYQLVHFDLNIYVNIFILFYFNNDTITGLKYLIEIGSNASSIRAFIKFFQIELST